MSNRSNARAVSAFSLLEVLAAISILAIVYTTLAGVAIEGLRTEGESRRRLEASLLADEELSNIELELEAGTVPEEGQTETELDDFVVSVTVQPFEVPATVDSQDPTGDTERQGVMFGAAEGREDGVENPLRQIDVSVSWTEGEFERRVTRTTYAFDMAAVEDLLASLSGDGGGGGGGGGGSGEPDMDQLRRQLEQQARGLSNQ